MVKQVTSAFKLDYDAIGKMSMQAVDDAVLAAADRAGEGFEGDIIWTDRPHGAVYATTFKARRKNAKENTLMKAVFS
jgi:hypothetical protein